MGAGLHGVNGVSPVVSLHMWETFSRSRMLFGLETIHLKCKEVKLLTVYHKKFLKQIQSLPDRVATTAVYALLGAEPVETTLDIMHLRLLMQILHQPGSIEHDLASRQLSLKDDNSKSWFIQAKNILLKYDLPSIYSLLLDPPAKREMEGYR